MKGQTPFLGHVESMRAIAALMVLAFHFITFEDGDGPLFHHVPLRNYAKFGAQGVELFYVISGFVIYNSLTRKAYTLNAYPKYLQKRFLRIFPPFFGAIALIALTPFIWTSGQPYALNQLVQNATLTVDLFGNTNWLNPIFATLKVEFLFYLLIGFLVVFMARNSWGYVLVSGLSLICVVLFPSIDLTHNIPFFLVGIACSEIYRSKNEFLNYAVLLACMVMLAVQFPIEDSVITVFAVVFLLWVKIKSKFLGRIGEFSYSIYLIHGVTGGLVLYICKSQKFGYVDPWVTLVISSTTALISSYLFFKVVEKRAVRWSKSVKY